MSQNGEWDANGQALFAMEQFALYNPGMGIPELYMEPIEKAARWIDRKRDPDNPEPGYAGLLPAGFSAEHLGPNDSFYWDQFWSLRGLESAANLMLMASQSDLATELNKHFETRDMMMEEVLKMAKRKYELIGNVWLS